MIGSIELGIWYNTGTNSHLTGFSDANWAGDINDWKAPWEVASL